MIDKRYRLEVLVGEVADLGESCKAYLEEDDMEWLEMCLDDVIDQAQEALRIVEARND